MIDFMHVMDFIFAAERKRSVTFINLEVEMGSKTETIT